MAGQMDLLTLRNVLFREETAIPMISMSQDKEAHYGGMHTFFG